MPGKGEVAAAGRPLADREQVLDRAVGRVSGQRAGAVSYTHLRAHETVLDLVCRLLLGKKKKAL